MKVVLVSVSWISKLTYSIIKDDRESTQSYINHIHITYNLIRITQYLINQKSNEEVVAAQIYQELSKMTVQNKYVALDDEGAVQEQRETKQLLSIK